MTHQSRDPAAINRQMRRDARAKAAMAIAGTAGGAAEARPSRVLETIQAGVKVQEMQDTDVLSGMGLSRLQIDAAAYLRDLWRDCLPGLDLPGALGDCLRAGGRKHLSFDEEQAAARAWLDYRRAMDYLRRNAGETHEAAVKTAVINGFPARWGAVKDGLDCLAKHWRMT